MRNRPQVRDVQDTRAINPAARPVDQYFQVGGGGVEGREILSLAGLIPSLNEFLSAERAATDERGLTAARDAVALRETNQKAFRDAVNRGEIEETDNPYFVIAEIEASTQNYLNRLELGVRNGLRAEHARAASVDPETGRPLESRGLNDIINDVDATLRKDGGGSLNTFYAKQVINQQRPEILNRLTAFDATQREEIRRQHTREQVHLAGVGEITKLALAGPLDTKGLDSLQSYIQQSIVANGIEKPAEFAASIVTSAVQQIARDQGFDEARDALTTLEELKVSRGRLIDRPAISKALRSTRIQLEQDERAEARRAETEDFEVTQATKDYIRQTKINVDGQEMSIDHALVLSKDPRALGRQILAELPDELDAGIVQSQILRAVEGSERLSGVTNAEMNALGEAYRAGDLEVLQAQELSGFSAAQRRELISWQEDLEQNPGATEGATNPLSREARSELRGLREDSLFSQIPGGIEDAQAVYDAALSDAQKAASEAPPGQRAQAYQKVIQEAQKTLQDRLSKVRQSRETVLERVRTLTDEDKITEAIGFLERNTTLTEAAKRSEIDRLEKLPTFYQKAGVPQALEGALKGELYKMVGGLTREDLGLPPLASDGVAQGLQDAKRLELEGVLKTDLRAAVDELRADGMTPNQIRDQVIEIGKGILARESSKIRPINPEVIKAAEGIGQPGSVKRVMAITSTDAHARRNEELLSPSFKPSNRTQRAQMDLLRKSRGEGVDEVDLIQEENEVQYHWATETIGIRDGDKESLIDTYRTMARDAGINPDNLLKGRLAFSPLKDRMSIGQNITKDIKEMRKLVGRNFDNLYAVEFDENGLQSVRQKGFLGTTDSLQVSESMSEWSRYRFQGLLKKNVTLRSSSLTDAPKVGQDDIRSIFRNDETLKELKLFRSYDQIEKYTQEAKENPESNKLKRYMGLVLGKELEGDVLENPAVQKILEAERTKSSYKRIQ